MQDRFKCRVWDKKNKCLHYPTRYSNFTIVNGTVVKIESYPIANSAYLGKRVTLEFDDAVIIQCTGLKDKNGKLIYENDIVTDVLTNKFTINFDEKYLSFLLTNIKTKESMVFYPNIKLEIIGNTFENKELLNGQ